MKQFTVILALVGLTNVGTARAAHFYVEATLRNGESVAGTVPEDRAKFDGVTLSGRTVKLKLEKLPGYAKRDWSEIIEWDEERGLFVVRAPGWTAELKRIWEQLELDPAPGGRKSVLKGGDVKTVRIRFVGDKKEDKKKKR